MFLIFFLIWIIKENVYLICESSVYLGLVHYDFCLITFRLFYQLVFLSFLSFFFAFLRFFLPRRSDLEHLRSVFMAVENGDLGMLKSLGIKDSELGDVKFFLEKLVNTGFLD